MSWLLLRRSSSSFTSSRPSPAARMPEERLVETRVIWHHPAAMTVAARAEHAQPPALRWTASQLEQRIGLYQQRLPIRGDGHRLKRSHGCALEACLDGERERR